MAKRLTKVAFVCLVVIQPWCDGIPKVDAAGYDAGRTQDPLAYVLDKCKTHDVVFLGTKHKRPRILKFISDLLPKLHEAGVTHLGLEAATDQQNKIDRYLSEGSGLEKIRLGYSIDCPPYRNIFKILRELRRRNGPQVVALDLPRSLYKKGHTRDGWMAKSLCSIFDSNPYAKVLVVVGNLHTLKKVVWEDHVVCNHPFIRGYLAKLSPSLRLFSIYQCIDETRHACDFARSFGRRVGPVAIDCRGPFAHWKLGVMDILAAKPLEAGELVDGVIVY